MPGAVQQSAERAAGLDPHAVVRGAARRLQRAGAAGQLSPQSDFFPFYCYFVFVLILMLWFGELPAVFNEPALQARFVLLSGESSPEPHNPQTLNLKPRSPGPPLCGGGAAQRRAELRHQLSPSTAQET